MRPTPAEIRSEPAGRTMDGWVHELIFGERVPTDEELQANEGQPWRWGTPFRAYSTDIAAAWLVEGEIERRGLQEQYAAIAVDLIGQGMRHHLGRGLYDDDLFRLIHADPLLRCRAALLCALRTDTERT